MSDLLVIPEDRFPRNGAHLITIKRLYNILRFFTAVKVSGNIQMKNCESFLTFAQNIDRGCTLETP